MKRRISAVVAVIVFVIALIMALLAHSPKFDVAGSVTKPLRPGVSAPIELTLTNPHSYPLTVTGVAITVTGVTESKTGRSSGCSTKNFAITQPAKVLPMSLGAHSSVTISAKDFPKSQWPKITMLKTKVLQDECKSVTLALSYTATGAFWGKS